MLSNPDSYHVWKGESSLIEQFNIICGDTYCEGDYSNLTPMAFDCSVNPETMQVLSCLWLFAGSHTEVNAKTGNISHNKKFFSCDLGFKGNTSDLVAYMKAVQKPSFGGWDTKIPGTNSTIQDVLGKCL